MTPTRFQVYLQETAKDREASRRFVRRASRGVFALLVSMGAFLWLLPIVRRHGHRTIGSVLELTIIAEFFALVFLVLLLRKRLAVEVERLSADQGMLTQQNERLAQQSAELEFSARRLTEAQAVARLGYWEIDLASGERHWSDEMYRIAGLEPGTYPVPIEQFIAAVHPEDRQRVTEVGQRARQELAAFNEQFRIAPTGRPTRSVQAIGRVVVDERGAQKLAGTIQDVTERVVLETQLRRSQKMEALGQLAGGVAHDFNNVLTVIDGYTGLLLQDGGFSAEAQADIEEIRAAAGRAKSLTRQLLAFSRQQVLQPRLLSINEAIANIEKMLRRLIDERIEFRTTLDAELHLVKADPTQIEQVVMNLVVNARDAMPDGGILTIETKNVDLDSSFVQRNLAHQPGPYVMLAVSDTGDGIPSQIIDRIFEPFFTTKAIGSGTGLGLSTVQGIAEQSGGHVWVYSELGHGTTFKVYLPRADGADHPAPARLAAGASRGGHETILIVEDNVAVRSVVATILRRAGYTVVEAPNGVEALRISLLNEPPIELVVSDMVMPDMGGRALASELSRRRPGLPVLLMSGYTRGAATMSVAVDASTAFIEKPFTPETLVSKVREVLDRAGSSPSAPAPRRT